MYLKALEIQGFKSFPEKTCLTFEKDVTAIVGPNGSGKSNIADAIMWVTGEQRSKALRGSKMEDVIFGGTERRNPMGYAMVSLVFDNTARIFNRNNDEIVLTRKYYRSGESEYSINKEDCRLKDIHELLMDTGLGRDGYSIIGQGRIAEIVSTKSTDRREVFEEAAGISRYRYRKTEAEDRLSKTEENLVRINDKIDELELSVGPLREQAETAKRYLILRDELRIKEISAWMTNLDRLREKTTVIRKEYAAKESELDSAKADLEALYASSGNLTERMRQKEMETEKIRENLSRTVSDISAHESSCAVINTKIKSEKEKLTSLLSDIEQQEKRTAEISAGIDENQDKISGLEKSISDNEKETARNNNIIAGCKMKMSSREASLSKIQGEVSDCESEINALDSKINILSEMEREYEGYSKAVRYIMRETARENLTGIFGPVADLISTDSEYALAIETALGAASQHIVTDTQKTGRRAIELLKKTDNGRATFLPLDTIRSGVLTELPSDDPGFIGLAIDLVSFEDKFYDVVADQLGHTIVVETLSDAIRVSNRLQNRTKIVTLDGQVVNIGGSMTGGSASGNAGMISRRNELNKLRELLESGKKKLETKKSSLIKAQQELDTIKYQLQLAQEDGNALASALSSLQAEKRAVESMISQLKALLYGISGDSDERRQAVHNGEQEIEGLKEQLESEQEIISQLRETEDSLKKQIEAMQENRSALEDKRSQTEKKAQSMNSNIMELERASAKIEQRKQAAEMEEKQILDRLWDNYELSYTSAESLRQPVESLLKTNKEIATLKNEISSLGTPNIGAIQEYSRVSERYDFLTTQRDDVLKAKADIRTIISGITDEMTRIFTDRFHEINEEFRKVFMELFGGGKASLVLEDEKNVLECGIEIKVQPPGKALSTISLLSGGEMAFVAIALYFAIIKVRPTPFCVMDEIEAALDESNVDRFADYLEKISGQTQFLVITHRRGTMEAAEMLYGVTMQEKGVSSVIKLDMKSAKQLQEG